MARILVIDDNREVRRVIQQALEYAGHEVAEAQNCWNGLVQFRRGGADLVVLDVSTSEPESHSAIDEMRSLCERVKILALSSRIGRRPARELPPAVLVGADDVLAKPFALLDLLVAVEGLLPGHRHRNLVVAS